jgi:hypothetical protein
MNIEQLKAAIGGIRSIVETEMKISPDDKRFGEVLLAGVDVISEVILDIKRIADAAEKGASPQVVWSNRTVRVDAQGNAVPGLPIDPSATVMGGGR